VFRHAFTVCNASKSIVTLFFFFCDYIVIGGRLNGSWVGKSAVGRLDVR